MTATEFYNIVISLLPHSARTLKLLYKSIAYKQPNIKNKRPQKSQKLTKQLTREKGISI